MVQGLVNGDMKIIMASFTPAFSNEFAAVTKGKSDKELAALFATDASALGDFQIVSKENKSDDELILHFRSVRMKAAYAPMKKVGDEWKISGNVKSEK
jgi:hypothetical protein